MSSNNSSIDDALAIQSNQSTTGDNFEPIPLSNEITPANPPPSTEEDKVEKPRPNEKMKMYLERQRYLSDLHTHLLGMGNTGFWIDTIIENHHILPTHRNFCWRPRLREQLCPLIWNAHAKKDQRRFIDGKCTAKFIDLLIQRNFPQNKISDGELHTIANDDTAAIGAFKGLIYNHEFICQLDHYGLSFGHVELIPVTQRYMGPQSHEIEGDFTYDVVLSLADLSKGLSVTMSQVIGSEDLIQSKVEEKLGLHVYPRRDDLPSEPFRRWIVFNARDQTFEVVKGITVEILRKLINIKANAPAQECILARAHIQNAFSMCNPDGSAPRLIDFDKFHGSFTPEFYPRRFALKDSIYSQRLDILATLLKYVLDRYQNCRPPVQYCELSVGVGDLSRPWVFDVLRSFPAHQPIIKQTFSLKPGSFTNNMIKNNHFPHLRNAFEMCNGEPLSCTLNVVYKFLVGFNRQHVQGNRLKNQDDALRLLNDSPNVAIHYMLSEIVQSEADERACYDRSDPQHLAETRQNSIFNSLIPQLEKLKKISSQIKDYYHWVVGLDLFGDEMGYPYCPFVAWPFRNFVEHRREFNRDFGLRIHCGENVPYADLNAGAYRHFIAHMYIVFRCLRYLQRKSRVRIRIGHGIAFARILNESTRKLHHRKSSVLLAEMKDHAKLVLKKIAFEVNLTSNEYLLGQALRGANFQQTLRLNPLDQHVPIILATDDDGVWPIDHCPSKHPGHHSLAAEYCRAISSLLIQNSKQLYRMLKNTQLFRFYSLYTRTNLQQAQYRMEKNTTGIPYEQDEVEEEYGQEEQNEENEEDEENGEQERFGQQEQTVQDRQYPSPTFEMLPMEDTNASTIIFHPDLIKTVLKKCYDRGCTSGKFYEDFGSLYQQGIQSFTIPDDESIWKIRCNNLAPIAFVAHCNLRGVNISHPSFSDEYVRLFDNTLSLKSIRDACTEFINQFKLSTDDGIVGGINHMNSNITFLSELPHENQLQRLRRYLQNNKNTTRHIRAFAGQVVQQATHTTFDENLIETSVDGMAVEVFTTNQKDKYSVLEIGVKRQRIHINKRPTKRTNVMGLDEQHALYVICEHASAATAYLHYIADALPVEETVKELIISVEKQGHSSEPH